MQLTSFINPNPITDENGITWDYYYLTSLVISTNIDNDSPNPSLYAEFYPARVLDGVKVINNNCKPEQIRQITIEHLFSIMDNSEHPMSSNVYQIIEGIMQSLLVIGQQNGIFKI